MNLKELLTPTRDKIKLFILLIATFVAPSVLEEYPTILYNVAAMLWFLFDTFLSYIFACVILYIWEKKGYTLSLRMLSILFPLLILITLFAFFFWIVFGWAMVSPQQTFIQRLFWIHSWPFWVPLVWTIIIYSKIREKYKFKKK